MLLAEDVLAMDSNGGIFVGTLVHDAGIDVHQMVGAEW